MALRNAFGNLALDATVQNIYTWLQARLGAKSTANSVSVNIANDQTVPVSAASLPLPSGAATSANQTTANTSLASLDGKAPALVSGRVPVDGSGVTQPVAPNISRGSGVMDANTTRVTLATDGPTVSALNSIDTKTPALVSGRQPVDGSGVTQPISASSLPLPTGAATQTTLANIDTDLGALADAAATTDTGSFSVIALIKRGLQNWTTLLGRVPALTVTSTRLLVDGSGVTQPVSDASGSLTVDSKAYRAAVTITRPSNTTAYTAGDVVGDTGGSAIITLSSIGPSAGYVLIQSVALVFSDASVPSGMAAFRVHFYSASPTAIADNAVFDLVSGDRANYLGYVDLPTPSDLGSSLYTQADYCGRLVKLASASTSLFAEIETRGGYTPASASTVLLTVNMLEAGL